MVYHKSKTLLLYRMRTVLTDQIPTLGPSWAVHRLIANIILIECASKSCNVLFDLQETRSLNLIYIYVIVLPLIVGHIMKNILLG